MVKIVIFIICVFIFPSISISAAIKDEEAEKIWVNGKILYKKGYDNSLHAFIIYKKKLYKCWAVKDNRTPTVVMYCWDRERSGS